MSNGHTASRPAGIRWEQFGKLPVFPQLNGVFVVNKLPGSSSAQYLTPFKRLGQKKIGHAGTLDPFASGVLLALLGCATKFSAHLQQGGHKIYRGVLRLGMETDTWDSTGQVLETRPPCLDADLIRQAVESWKDCREQVVPVFSAAKHNGQALYKLARTGRWVPEKIKEIRIFGADLLDIDPPHVTFRVICGSGAYIRSLAHSLGKRLGCGACLHELTREYSYPFDLSSATALEDLLRSPDLLVEKLIPIQDALPDWPRVNLGEGEERLVRNGRFVRADANGLEPGSLALLLRGDTALAIGELFIDAGKPMWAVKRGLWN